MHDWTLLSIVLEWRSGQVSFSFKSETGPEHLIAHSVSELLVSQHNEWGPSVSVNEVRGPFTTDGGFQSLEVEMQSGDILKVTARSFELPKGSKTR